MLVTGSMIESTVGDPVKSVFVDGFYNPINSVFVEGFYDLINSVLVDGFYNPDNSIFGDGFYDPTIIHLKLLSLSVVDAVDVVGVDVAMISLNALMSSLLLLLFQHLHRKHFILW